MGAIPWGCNSTSTVKIPEFLKIVHKLINIKSGIWKVFNFLADVAFET